MPSFLCVKSTEVPISRYKCLLKGCDVVEGLLAGVVWEVIFVMAVPTLTSPTVMIPSWRNLCTTQYFPVNYIYLCIWVCVCVDKWDHPFLWECFFILSRTFFLSLAPFQELNNNNRAKGLLSHLVSAVQCLHWGVGSPSQLQGLLQLESAAFPSSDNMGCFQSSLAAGQVLARKWEMGTRKTNTFFFFGMCLNTREKWQRKTLDFEPSGIP